MELAGIANQRNTLNENSPALQKVIAQLTDELADEIEVADDPMGVILPRILDKLKKLVADPNNGLGSDDIAKIKNEIKVFSELMTKYSSTSIAQELADMNEARTEVNEYIGKEHIQPEDLAKHIVDKLIADKSLTQFIESLSVYNDDATPASAKPQHRRMLEDVLINIIRS